MVDKETLEKSSVALKEEKILDFWNEREIFKKTLEKDAPNGNFVFYDGPPFATGLPHYGHILAGTIKDVIPRYQTMNGKRVLRRWGWDCHGLPIENLVEKELGFKSKKDIEDYGVEKFNFAARNTVTRYADEWKKIIPRSGRWADMDNDYRTMDWTYTESVWWSFKTLYDKKLAHQSFKSMLLCPHCETTLSNFEVNQGYKDITDISVYVEFELLDEPGTYFLAWTTTPWTLPGNVALAINNDIEYIEVSGENPDKKYILAKSQVESVFGGKQNILREIKAKDLVGKKYKPIFDYYDKENLDNRENAWKVYAGDFVKDEEGTGIVHVAPAFGEEDMNLGKENNLPFIQHVNVDGTFKLEVTDFAGQKVKPIEDNQKTDVEIIKFLAKKGSLFKKLKIVHSYPHCWRCDTPLLNYATTSWFVNVTAMKDRLVEINSKISWTPEEIGSGRFGKWLEGARDWAVSRTRYWGAPLPVWLTESGEKVVLGSVSELKEKTKKSGNKYFIVRHGEGEHNVANILSSKKDDNFHLTEKGKKQVEDAAEILKDKGITKIISSPFIRTIETAEIIRESLGLNKDKLSFDGRLGEHDLGVLSGQSVDEYHKIAKTGDEVFDVRVEKGENLSDVKVRTGNFLYDVDKINQNEVILLVTHEHTSWALEAVSHGYNKKETIAFGKDNNGEFIKNAEIHEVDFVPLPHNENYELDLHRPYIDNVVLLDNEGREMKRVPEVFDTWYDSGSMSFAQQHYPFENKEEFEKNNSQLFPADFIAEGLDQTRGWFYTSLVLAVGLFDKSSYNHVLVNGLVLAEDGKKMSKSLKNYPDLMDIINKYGADALRYYLMSSPLVKAEDFNFSEKGVDEIHKKLIQKIYNVLSFYEMYMIKSDEKPIETILDKWILSRLNELRKITTSSLDKYELDKASRPILDFVEDLSTWYIRRSRDRFKSEDFSIRYSATYYTGFVLIELSKIIAPFMPFLAEEVYLRVKGEKESVHLEFWPESGEIDLELIEKMKNVREIVTGALELRQKAGHKVRQPLLTLQIPVEFSKDLLEIIADEVNVKEVLVGKEIRLDTNLTEELTEEGIARDIIRAIQDARKTEKLNPGDVIKIVFCTDKQSILYKYSEMIKVPTGVSDFSYSDKRQHHVISDIGGETTFGIQR